MDLIQTRFALAEALSSHDAKRIQPFLHPSYVIRDAGGAVVLDCPGFVRQLPRFFEAHPEYKQAVEVEQAVEQGSTATLTTRHVDVLRTWWRAHPIPSRWDETWCHTGDRWLLLEEKPHQEASTNERRL